MSSKSLPKIILKRCIFCQFCFLCPAVPLMQLVTLLFFVTKTTNYGLWWPLIHRQNTNNLFKNNINWTVFSANIVHCTLLPTLNIVAKPKSTWDNFYQHCSVLLTTLNNVNSNTSRCFILLQRQQIFYLVWAMAWPPCQLSLCEETRVYPKEIHNFQQSFDS